MHLRQRLPEYVIGQMLQHFGHHHTIEEPIRPRNFLTIANLCTAGLSQVVLELLHRSCVRIQAVHLDAP